MSVRTFLPWYRVGYASALDGAPPAGSGRARVPATVRLRGASGAVDMPLELAGPGDVAGIDPREILRTEPFDGCTDFEPSYFPYVELASADLPWRFTPEGPQSQRVRPWLALVVVPADGATLTPAAAGTSVLRCDVTELPDPSESWAWAHVQVTDGIPVARLLCPRRLEAGVQYLACVVPTFAAGLLSGTTGDPLGPAWSGWGTVELPAYHHWSFRTGPEGSFEAVVRRLRPRPVPAGTGGREIATGAPGWGAKAGSPSATVRMQGALRPIDVTEPEADDPLLAESLRTAVSSSGTGLELRPPLYGQDYQRGLTALPPGTGGWLAELNTDARRRIAAGLASFAVAVHQEDLADSAWRQLAAARADGRQQVDPALADAVTGSLSDRHLAAAPAVPALNRLLRAGGAPLSPVAPAPPRPVPADDLFAPRFDEPGYALLRGIAPEWLLPELGELPTDSVALAQTNGAFVESFMVGLNHALARELTWRRFPLRVDGTFFDRFWGSSGGAGSVLPPIGEWDPADELGSHSGAADRLVLLLRGTLLRRFPTASIYLSRDEERLPPEFAGRIGTDCAFLGFGLTVEQAMGAGWFVVVEEALGHARFGCDDPPDDGTTRTLDTWQDLDWAHPALIGHTHAPIAGPLVGVARPVAPGSSTTAAWGLDAANQAAAVLQPAFRARIPVALWLTT